ncbi:N-formylglutamate amidohydrolase [Candidatus Woesearchaeota archaeon]|jgi:N-formylglutamate amidohydrolase|nr:N-formylglutamate amidohydrolase [Candidatus Woesearchaeota archaeon]
MEKIKEVIESISPILIRSTTSSFTIGISKRFFLFKLMNKLITAIEEDPHLNFVSLLKNYKVLGRFLTGTLHEFYRDRNRLYFKNFFIDRSLYEIVKADLEYLYPDYKNITMTITKNGVIIYDNYKKRAFNTLLMTIHSGTWVPESIKHKLHVTDKERNLEEDRDTHKLYCKLVLDKSGIWIDNKQSRFIIDFNRSIENSIYETYTIRKGKKSKVWAKDLTVFEEKLIRSSYREFYFTLATLLDTHEFNIIFDGHSMKDLPGRPNISFGTRYIPNFYIPIVKSMQRKMITLKYSPVLLNTPYGGGFILKWLSTKFPNIFIFSMEVNKKLYMTKDRMRTIDRKLNKLLTDLINIFDIDSPEEDGKSIIKKN